MGVGCGLGAEDGSTIPSVLVCVLHEKRTKGIDVG